MPAPKIIIPFVALGAAFASTRSEEPTDDPRKVVRATSAKLVTEVGFGKVDAPAETQAPINLAQTTWLAEEIMKCLEKSTESPNANVFYSAQSRYLKSQQRLIAGNPEKIREAVEKEIKTSEDWFKEHKKNDFAEFKEQFKKSGAAAVEYSFVSASASR